MCADQESSAPLWVRRKAAIAFVTAAAVVWNWFLQYWKQCWTVLAVSCRSQTCMIPRSNGLLSSSMPSKPRSSTPEMWITLSDKERQAILHRSLMPTEREAILSALSIEGEVHNLTDEAESGEATCYGACYNQTHKIRVASCKNKSQSRIFKSLPSAQFRAEFSCLIR